ncbi:hypothetical protein C8R47DRAFT_1044693 [Mycena vitilis]|nr:hypothetical protein C8R47DRAFT_1044693 [Mycena vitilis]
MSQPPTLETLKKGYVALQAKIQKRKDDLKERLQKEERIDPADADWLDQDANLVDEEAVIEKLEKAPDGFACLDANEMGLVEALKDLAGGESRHKAPELVSNKRQRLAERKKPEKGKKAPAAPIFTKKENTTLAQRIEILDWHHARTPPNQSATARHFSALYPNLCIKQPLISSWLKSEEKWRDQWAEAQEHGRSGDTKRVKQVEHPEVDDMLELWVTKAMADRVHLSRPPKWTRFADLAGIPADERLGLSEGWLTSFKKRCGLKEFKRHGEADSANPVDIEADRKRVQEIILHEGYALRDVFNMDETGLFWA